MENYRKELLKEFKKERPTYRDIIKFCCDSCVLNNYIVPELSKKDIFFDVYTGSERTFYNANGDEITEQEFYELEDQGAYDEYDDIYQYYIISSSDADRLADFTHQLVIYNEDLDLYLLCVKHFGTAWDGVFADWKEPEEIED